MKNLTDNSVPALRKYLQQGLASLYDVREAENIVTELFHHFFQWSRSDLVMKRNERLSESEILQFHFALKKLKRGIPLQYVTGVAWFCGLKFEVNEHVLIPRPETEDLVNEVVKRNQITSPRILDIGTGSGCIAVSLKKKIPGAEVFACDVSEEALMVAEKNGNTNDVDVSFFLCDVLNETPQHESFDIIVSNPPYIKASEKSSMHKRVADHEPPLALFVPDDDSLIFYKRILQLSPSLLKHGGMIAVECHEQYASEAMKLFSEKGKSEIVKDMQGKERMVIAQFQNS